MRKLLSFLVIFVLCAGCKNYQADIDDYLSYWSTQAAIVRSGFDPAITVQTDTDTIQSIPSSSDVTVTFTVRNPKNFTFQLPGDAGAPTDIVVFPTDVAGTTTPTPKHPDDYELTQDSNSQLTLTYKQDFLQKHEYGKKNIGPTITLYAKDGRKFSETFKLNVKANTPPPNLIYRAIGKTTAADGRHYYVLCLEVPDMYREINSSELLHKDIKYLSIAEGSGSYTSIPLTVKADKSGFDISGAGGRLLGYSDATALLPTDVESGVTPDILPASTETWILRVKTNVEVQGAVKQYRFRLQDEAGLFSTGELHASTSTNKVSPVTITVKSGSWTVTPKHGTNDAPHEITYGPGVQNILLKAETATSGATVHYKLERNGLTVSESSDTTPLTIELPAAPDVVYKLTAWAEHAGFDNSQNIVVFYNSKGLEVSATEPGAWQRLKDAVESAADGDVIIVNGVIQATSAANNHGEIAVTKSITIRGKNGSGSDILDANKTTGGKDAHRIFKVTNCNLTLEGLTLKGGMATDTSEYDKKLGGGIYGKNIQNLTIKNCIIQNCEATTSGGGIYITTAADKPPIQVTIADTQILQNTAVQSGGGLEFRSDQATHITGILDSVTIRGNSLTSTAENPLYGGAGVCFSGGYTKRSTLTVKGGSIDGNNAGELYGGGIYIKTGASGSVNGTLTLKDGVRISGNTAKNGGGIAVHSATLIIEPGCTIGGDNASQGNTAKTSGGGISVGKKAECTIKEGVTIRHNRVSNGTNIMDGGGGLYIKDTGTQADNGIVTITGTLGNPVRIEDNEARGSIGVGGGIANNGTITLTHVHISGCKAPDSAGLGGGIFVRHGQCTMIDSKVRACVAQGAGGGVYVYKDPTVSGLFTMQGNSRIVPSGDDVKGKNDIFLKDNNTPGTTSYINLSGKLTGTRPIGRITVPDGSYSEGTKVLDGNITVGENYKKFTVTSKSGQNWYINTAGKLTTTTPSP
ncbi:hypothetical protein ABH09_10395 [Treponema sp. OMZ 803]|uniref:hypothetical protein n=1 Tax=Treponema sp. OMZ 803 TaxID=120682 RepID=UPI0020A503A9|nr:hypothetical protein [Treponema sp. OMZ 803]UTC52737.1 hypothetical protein ABH09_10395 [Treponema sp. OMZ 803]